MWLLFAVKQNFNNLELWTSLTQTVFAHCIIFREAQWVTSRSAVLYSCVTHPALEHTLVSQLSDVIHHIAQAGFNISPPTFSSFSPSKAVWCINNVKQRCEWGEIVFTRGDCVNSPCTSDSFYWAECILSNHPRSYFCLNGSCVS